MLECACSYGRLVSWRGAPGGSFVGQALTTCARQKRPLQLKQFRDAGCSRKADGTGICLIEMNTIHL